MRKGAAPARDSCTAIHARLPPATGINMQGVGECCKLWADNRPGDPAGTRENGPAITAATGRSLLSTAMLPSRPLRVASLLAIAFAFVACDSAAPSESESGWTGTYRGDGQVLVYDSTSTDTSATPIVLEVAMSGPDALDSLTVQYTTDERSGRRTFSTAQRLTRDTIVTLPQESLSLGVQTWRQIQLGRTEDGVRGRLVTRYEADDRSIADSIVVRFSRVE